MLFKPDRLVYPKELCGLKLSSLISFSRYCFEVSLDDRLWDTDYRYIAEQLLLMCLENEDCRYV